MGLKRVLNRNVHIGHAASIPVIVPRVDSSLRGGPFVEGEGKVGGRIIGNPGSVCHVR